MDTTSQTGTVENAPTSFTLGEGISAIESLLSDDRESDPKGSDGQKPVTEEAKEAPVSDEEPELVFDDEETGDVANTEAKAPVTVDDNYELEIDGEKITLGQLKRNNLFQRDYSKKTEELARERDALKSESQRLRSEVENEFKQRVEFINQYARKFIPTEPPLELLQQDPMGYFEAKAKYEQDMNEWKQIEQLNLQEQNQRTEQQEKQAQQYKAEEQAKLLGWVPSLKDEAKRNAFIDDLDKVGIKHYGLTQEEIPQILDARYMRILHDAIQYQKALAKAKASKQQLSTKPKLDPKQRMNVSEAQGRDRFGRFEELRKDRSLAAAARSIEDLID